MVADGAAGNGTMCDALSTALFVMGEDRALELWRSGVYDFDLILVTEDGPAAGDCGHRGPVPSGRFGGVCV